jgi:hypothetical protein
MAPNGAIACSLNYQQRSAVSFYARGQAIATTPWRLMVLLKATISLISGRDWRGTPRGLGSRQQAGIPLFTTIVVASEHAGLTGIP